MLATSDFILTDAEFARISELVYKHCGINLRCKKSLVEARVTKRLRAGGFDSLGDYFDFVAADASGKEFTQLIDAISTNLTSFYREATHFRYLAEVGIPELIKRKAAKHDYRIRVWSAACSTGEEPYTLAMILLDSIPGIKNWDVKILATDISTHVLKVARRGFYEGERLKPLPHGYQTRFFRPATVDGDRGFTVAPELSEMIAFRHLNLVENWSFTGPFEFIFCRNVMIYFDKPTQERLVNRFTEVMSPEGVLFTGHSESLTGVKHSLKYVLPTIYAKV